MTGIATEINRVTSHSANEQVVASRRSQGPGLLKMAIRFAQAVTRHVAGGLRTVSDEHYAQRLEACNQCPHKANTRCLQCGCFLAKKARWQSEDCPLGKWPADAHARPLPNAERAPTEPSSDSDIPRSSDVVDFRVRHPKLRTDLVTTRQDTDGVVYLVQDPATSSFVRFREIEHFIAQQLDGENSLEEISERAERHFSAPLPMKTLKGFVEKLWELKLLQSPNSQPRKPSRVRGNLLHLRVKVVDPDRPLAWLAPKLGFIFTRSFLMLSALFITAAVVIFAANWGQVSRGLLGMATVQNVLLGLVAMLVITTLHEFAHGLTCRRFGGEVHEIGFLLIYFSPAFYCDVSSAWQFSEKSKRLWVTFAGAYFELICWAAAVMVWRMTQPDTWVHRVAVIVMAASGLKSFFNLNPLIKLDGYYLLSDALEIPNLRQRAFAYVGRRVKRWAGFTKRREDQPVYRERLVYLVYGFLAAIYSVSLLVFVALRTGGYLTQRFQAAGFIAFLLLFILLFRQPLGRLLYLPAGLAVSQARRRGQMGSAPAGLRRRGVCKMVVFMTLFSGLLWAAFNCRMDLRVAGEFEVLPEERVSVRPMIDGLIEEVFVEENDRVYAGQTVARLSDHDLRYELQKVEAQLGKLCAGLKALEDGPRAEEVELTRKELCTAKARLAQCEKCLAEARQFRSSRLAQAETTVELAESRLELAASNLARSASLLERRALSRAEFETQQQQQDAREKELAMAQSKRQMVRNDKLAKLEEARVLVEKQRDEVSAKLQLQLAGTRAEQLEAAKSEIAGLEAQRQFLTDQLKRTSLVSPIDGIVTSMRTREQRGKHVQRGESVIEVERLQTVSVMIRIPEKEIGAVKLGQPIALKARAYPEHTFHGRLQQIAAKVSIPREDDLTPMVLVTTTLANNCRMLKPGMTGKAKIHCGERRPLDLFTRRLARNIRVEFWSWW